jgi:hypothetical protein
MNILSVHINNAIYNFHERHYIFLGGEGGVAAGRDYD